MVHLYVGLKGNTYNPTLNLGLKELKKGFLGLVIVYVYRDHKGILFVLDSDFL